jgi:hypothetical protein
MPNPFTTLLLFSFAMLTLPVGGFFASKSIIYEGEKGLTLKTMAKNMIQLPMIQT